MSNTLPLPPKTMQKIAEFTINELTDILPQSFKYPVDFYKEQYCLAILQTFHLHKPKMDSITELLLFALVAQKKDGWFRFKTCSKVRITDSLHQQLERVFAKIGIYHYILAYQWHVCGFVPEDVSTQEETSKLIKAVYFHPSLKSYLTEKIKHLQQLLQIDLLSNPWPFTL